MTEHHFIAHEHHALVQSFDSAISQTLWHQPMHDDMQAEHERVSAIAGGQAE